MSLTHSRLVSPLSFSHSRSLPLSHSLREIPEIYGIVGEASRARAPAVLYDVAISIAFRAVTVPRYGSTGVGFHGKRSPLLSRFSRLVT